MATFAPPPGPPPSAPEGWKAQFDTGYKEWFYINLLTGKSQWERPRAPARADPDGGLSSSEPPPSYESDVSNSAAASVQDKKSMALGSNNPYNRAETNDGSPDSDAAKLQAKEDAGSSRLQSPQKQEYGTAPRSTAVPEQHQKQPSNKKGFFSKLMGKSSHRHGHQSQAPGYNRPQEYQQETQYRYPQPIYNVPPQRVYPGQYPEGYYTPPQPAYGYGGGYGPQPYYSRQSGSGMSTGMATAMGVGGGLLGGLLLADIADDAMMGGGFGDAGDFF